MSVLYVVLMALLPCADAENHYETSPLGPPHECRAGISASADQEAGKDEATAEVEEGSGSQVIALQKDTATAVQRLREAFRWGAHVALVMPLASGTVCMQ